ncbi:unnamed protein product [Spirodela intermedia]|uniref:Uncharacterized protein n=1 Tax=Spirodela intermedia TaxID=51605 RepID=A0ABN7E9J9_SPIIN|nr:unnamed protein product [Spirodela intermedia]
MWNLTELGISITWMTHEDMQAVLNSQRLSASIRFLCVLEVGIRSIDFRGTPNVLAGIIIHGESRAAQERCKKDVRKDGPSAGLPLALSRKIREPAGGDLSSQSTVAKRCIESHRPIPPKCTRSEYPSR